MKLEDENKIHAILSGTFINGFIQGNSGREMNSSVVEEALKEIKKILKKTNKIN